MAKISGTLHQYPQNLASNDEEYPHYVTFTVIHKLKTTSNETVALYLPAEALKSSYTQTYGDTDLGAVGVAMNSVTPPEAARLQTRMENLAKNIGGANILGAVSDVIGGAGQAGSIIASMGIGKAITQAAVNDAMNATTGTKGQVIKALQQKSGRIVNPHKALLYSGPGGFRTFNFNYVMTPENPDEAKSIARIVHFFKWHMHPGTPGGLDAGHDEDDNVNARIPEDISNSLSLSYPEEFQIKMFVNRKAMKKLQGTNNNRASLNNPLFRIKNCFLESLNIDYSTSGAPAFITNKDVSVPATTTMSMQFKETVLMTKTSIGEGF